MDWYQNLYVGKTASKRKKEIIEKIEAKQNMLCVFLITIAPDIRNQLEIVTPSVYYRQGERQGFPMILGIAWGMREANALLIKMTEEVYGQTGGADLRSYFERCQGII